MPADAFVRYSPNVEVPQPDEEQTFEEIKQSMLRLGHLMTDRYRHAIRSVHAKSHGLLKATTTVLDAPPEYRQGMFASPGRSYGTVLRFSTNPGDILADSVSTPRGVAIKFIGVDGPMVEGHEGHTTQDLVIAVGQAFVNKDGKAFLKGQKVIEAHANDPEPEKKIVSGVVRGVNAVAHAVGIKQTGLEPLGYPNTHILGETFYSQAAVRYGDYVAKIRVAPFSQNLKDLAAATIKQAFHYSAILDAVLEFFKTQTAEWEVSAQLCKDLKAMPVEDASAVWDESVSPYVPVARVVAGPQDAYTPARRVFVDDRMSFSPWHAAEAHRPLGNIMRARRASYRASAELRQHSNAVENAEPKSLDEVPD